MSQVLAPVRRLCGVLLLALVLLTSGCANAPSAASSKTLQKERTYMTSNGTQLTYGGVPMSLAGAAFYPGLKGGTAAWHRRDFTQYIDHIVALAQMAGQNVLRPTDYWSRDGKHQVYTDPIVWANMDYLMKTAQQHGMFVILDLSAYRWLLVSQGRDPYSAANWSAFLQFVSERYKDSPAIAYYSLAGEPEVPKTQRATAKLVSFYRSVTDMLYRDDGGHHLIAAGGFLHMGTAGGDTSWWQQIEALPHNDVLAFKIYSQHDLNIVPALSSVARRLHKPLVNEEFGLPQDVGDSTPTGKSFNDLTLSRARFFSEVYASSAQYGVALTAFWNLGCQIQGTSFEVNPKTAGVWRVVSRRGPAAHRPWPFAGTPC